MTLLDTIKSMISHNESMTVQSPQDSSMTVQSPQDSSMTVQSPQDSSTTVPFPQVESQSTPDPDIQELADTLLSLSTELANKNAQIEALESKLNTLFQSTTSTPEFSIEDEIEAVLSSGIYASYIIKEAN